MSPPIIHAAKTSLAEPTARAISLLTKKIPEPIVSLITIAVAAHRPRPRTRSDRSGGLFGFGLVACTKDVLGGDANRLRVHIKTAKLGFTLNILAERGIRNFKCATTLELLVACRSGAGDVLFAYPAIGANALRVREISDQFPGVRISALAENEEQVRQWRGSR